MADYQDIRTKRSRTKITNFRRWQVFFRDKFRCQQCGVQATVTITDFNLNGTPMFIAEIQDDARQKCTRLEIDHLVPHSKGGTDQPDNLRALCWFCNSTKSSKQT